jgi:hypothetical protein
MISILPYITQDIGIKYKVDMDNELLENHKPISIDEAKDINRKYIFSWKWRLCEVCLKDFDITEQGLYYRCEECL